MTVRGISTLGIATLLLIIGALAGWAGTITLGALGIALICAALVSVHWNARRRSHGLLAFASISPPMLPCGHTALLTVTIVNAAQRMHEIPYAVERPPAAWPRSNFADLRKNTGHTARAQRVALAPSLLRSARPLRTSQGSPISATFPVSASRRGTFALSGIKIWVYDPFGLFGVPVAVTNAVALTVYPSRMTREATRTAGVEPASLASATSSALQGQNTAVLRSDLGDFAGLRRYVPGDRIQLLHWQALALYDELLVRQFDPDTVEATRIVLDDRAGVHLQPLFEVAVRSVADMIESAIESGTLVELLTCSGLRFSFPPTSSGISLSRLALASLRPRHSPPSQHSLARCLGVGHSTVVTTYTAAADLAGIAPASCDLVVVSDGWLSPEDVKAALAGT